MPVKRDRRKKPFKLPTSEDYSENARNLPHIKQHQSIMEDPAERKKAGALLYQLSKDMFMPRIHSNEELVERINNYFIMVSGEEVYPTIEHLALYCGVTSRVFQEWRNGNVKGFSDPTPLGDKTADIANKAVEAIHAFDAAMAYNGDINFLAYCFRSKNYYGMRDKTEITFATSERLSTPQTPEEIAAFLPDNQIEVEGEVK